MEPLYPIPQAVSPSGPEADAVRSDLPLSVGRIAAYDPGVGATPRVVEVHPAPVADYIEHLSAKTYELAHAMGGTIPYTVIREVTENFIHAGFAEPVISILDEGATIRFADQGPGISDKAKARMPGFTSASSQMKRYIRGVGSGLPIVSDFLAMNGGVLTIEDNISTGTVVTISAGTRHSVAAEQPAPTRMDFSASMKDVNRRQLQVLALMVDAGPVGPTIVSKELSISAATAHRDLALLESKGLIESTDDRRRVITDAGFSVLDARLHR